MPVLLSEYTITTGQAAEKLGVSVDTIQRWADDGLLPSVRNPGKRGFRKFRPADIDEMARKIREPSS